MYLLIVLPEYKSLIATGPNYTRHGGDVDVCVAVKISLSPSSLLEAVNTMGGFSSNNVFL